MRARGGRIRAVVAEVVAGVLVAGVLVPAVVSAPAAAAVSAPYAKIAGPAAGNFDTRDYLGSLAVDEATHALYVSQENHLTKIDGFSDKVVGSLALNAGTGLAVDPASHAVFASQDNGSAYSVVDGATLTATGTSAQMYVGVHDVVLDQDAHRLFVAVEADSPSFGLPAGVWVMDEGTGARIGQVPIPQGAQAEAYDPSTHRLYVSHFHDYKISVIDTQSLQEIAVIDLGQNGVVNQIAVDPATGLVWAGSYATGVINLIEESTNSIVKTIPVGYAINGIGINPAEHIVFVSDIGSLSGGNGRVVFLDEQTHDQLGEVETGGTADRIAVDADLDRVYVADNFASRIEVLAPVATYGPGTISFASSTYSTRAGSPATVTLYRYGATDLTSTVSYSTADATAVAGTDYTATTGKATFAAGATTTSFVVPTSKHGPITATPTVELSLGSVTGGSLRDPHAATLSLQEANPPLVSNPKPPDTAVINRPFSYRFSALGSPAPTWSIGSGAPPAGLTLNPTTGTLAGTPTTGGPATFTVRADNGAAPASTSQPLTITVDTPPVFTDQSPPTSAAAGSFYGYQYQATGEPLPTFSVASGTLPAGTAVQSNGGLYGTLRGPGTFTFRIKASNGVSPDAISAPATVTITGAPVTPDAPAVTGVTAGNGAAAISFAPPGYDGGAAITGYTVTASPGGRTATGRTSPITVGGLTNGTAYTFAVTATNSAGTSAASASSAAVTPQAPVTTTLRVGATRTIAAGAAATVSAVLTRRSDGHAIAAAAVVLLSRPGRTGAFAPIATLRTTASGAVSAHVKPTRFTQYEFAFRATSTYATSSGVETVAVRSVVALAASSRKAKRGKAFTLYGTVLPAHSGDVVALQRLVRGRWVSARTSAREKLQRLPNGRKVIGFVFTVKQATAGAYAFRVTRAATPADLAGTSGKVTVSVT